MKNQLRRVAIFGVTLMLGLSFFASSPVIAEEADTTESGEAASANGAGSTSISISPVSKVMQLLPSTIYEDVLNVTNNGSSAMDFEVYASPYAYTYSEDDDEYKLGFNTQNNYTQITRWIKFKNESGEYVEKIRRQAQAGETVEVAYKISTPSSIPNGGQYAVIFARTLASNTSSSGVKTEASPGMVIYGRSNGETITKAEFSDLTIEQTLETGSEKKSLINAYGKVKNSGNVDFLAQGVLTVKNVFGQVLYETTGTDARVSVIPETELEVSDSWEDTPYFGIFNATWSITAAGETESVTQQILILPTPIIIAVILLLTFIIIWIIILVRKRKERRARFMI